MSVSGIEVDRRVAQFAQALRDNDLRITHQRLEVIREIASSVEHPDVEQVFQGTRERVPTISIDTVYRTLAVLADRGLITRVSATQGAMRYDANLDQHHHFVCTRCGLVRDVESSELDALAAPHDATAFGSVESVQVNLRGVCTTCALRSAHSKS